MHQTVWASRAKSLLKAEIKKNDITYGQLVIKLKSIGVDETVENLTTKINRGTFSAIFFLQCLSAMGSEEIVMNNLGSDYDS